MSEIATTGSALPAIYQPAPLDIGSDDIALPRVKVGQKMTKADGVTIGQIFASTGEDDAEILYDPKKSKVGVLIHILGLTRGKSISDGGELVSWAYNDPDAPSDAWTTYNYLLCLPEVDTDLPYKWLFTRTGAPSAKQMNTVLKRNATVPPYTLAFRVETKQKENPKGVFAVPRVTQVEADPAHVVSAERLAQMIAGSSPDQPVSGADEPAI